MKALMQKRPVAPLESGGRNAPAAVMATGCCDLSMRSRRKTGFIVFYLRFLQKVRKYGPLLCSYVAHANLLVAAAFL